MNVFVPELLSYPFPNKPSGGFRGSPPDVPFPVGRLRGRDFLKSRRHPTILFEAGEFLPNQQRSGGELRGNLTLLGMTHPIILDVKVNKFAKYPFGHRKETIGISANTVPTPVGRRTTPRFGISVVNG